MSSDDKRDQVVRLRNRLHAEELTGNQFVDEIMALFASSATRESVIEECVQVVLGMQIRSFGLGSGDVAEKLRVLKSTTYVGGER